ncbi:MAG: PaREP1 family protein [Pyrobaculum sp.]
MDALVLPSRVVELLRRAAEEGGVSLEDFLMDVAAARLDPPERARAYAEAALELLREAEAELARGDLRQASEEVWGTAALAVKAFAYWRDGVRLASHGELWRYAEKVAEELGEWVRDAWAHANAMHVNFYEGWASGEQVAAALNRVRRLVEAVAGRVLSRGKRGFLFRIFLAISLCLGVPFFAFSAR